MPRIAESQLRRDNNQACTDMLSKMIRISCSDVIKEESV